MGDLSSAQNFCLVLFYIFYLYVYYLLGETWFFYFSPLGMVSFSF